VSTPDAIQLALLETGQADQDPVVAAFEERVVGPMLRFRVLGHAVTKAGMRAVGPPDDQRLIGAGGKGLKGWQGHVAAAALEARLAAGWPILEEPVGLDLLFQYLMPTSRTKWWRALERVPKGTGDDLDKLIRAVGDGLQAGGVIRDDRQIAYLLARKDEVAEGWEGVEIRLRPLPIVKRGAA